MASVSSKVELLLIGAELLHVPSALTVHRHVPFRAARWKPTTEEAAALDRVWSAVSDARDHAFRQIAAAEPETPRSEIIERRKRTSITIEVSHDDLVMACRALREVIAEYAEPNGINVFFGGDEYGVTLADLVSTTERLCRLVGPRA